MTKKKENRGGKRPGAGRPSGSTGEIKKNVTIKLYPSQKKKLQEKYGSVQKAVDSINMWTIESITKEVKMGSTVVLSKRELQHVFPDLQNLTKFCTENNCEYISNSFDEIEIRKGC